MILSHIQNDSEKQSVIKVLNKAESALKHYTLVYTDFLDPYELSLCTCALNKVLRVKYNAEGGYKNSERKLLVIYPEDFWDAYEINDIIDVLSINGSFSKGELTHRDFLGSLLGLGIKREKIGDILIDDGRANVILSKEISEYIRFNLKKVSKFNVSVGEASFEDLEKHEEQFKWIHATAAALRLDIILGIGFGKSRSSITKFINNDRVKVNWKPINQPSYMIAEGDIISFRGRGRIILENIKEKTKNGRYKVVVKRLM